MAAPTDPTAGSPDSARGDVRGQLRTGLLLADGAMGTMLGAGGGDFLVPEELNLREPERVACVHATYAEAGSRVVSTNSFGASPAKLALAGLDDRAAEINRLAAGIARSAVGDRVLVAGSIGPTGRFLEPLGDLSEAEALAGFILQADSLAAGGADLLIVETMSALDEARLAVRAAVRTGLPVVTTMTFEPAARGDPRTMMGVTLLRRCALFHAAPGCRQPRQTQRNAGAVSPDTRSSSAGSTAFPWEARC